MIDEKLAAWTLSGIDGIGPAAFLRLMEKFGSAAEVFEAGAETLYKSETLSPQVIGKILCARDWEGERTKFELSIPEGAAVVAFSEPGYPERLKNIADPPPYLYLKGKCDIFERPALAIVGSRRPTDYGLRMTSRLAGELAAAGVLIVSGLAYGIDGAAHQAALEAGGITAAVFGCGLDYIYPPGHRTLASRIMETGCLISEFPKGTRPERFNFPVRNRVVAGLSDGVLVIEAGQKSGALVTASIALDQGRDVMAIPGSIDSELSLGPNGLIKQGAVAVTSVDDIFANFGWHRSEAPREQVRDTTKLSKDEQLVYGLLTVQPIHLDEIGRRTLLGPGKTAEALLNLELKGFIMRKPGNFVVKA